jgi:hypothetical protein
MSRILNNAPPLRPTSRPSSAGWPINPWQRETAIHSNLTVRYAHLAYQRIVALGPAANPLPLRELARNRTWLIGAL